MDGPFVYTLQCRKHCLLPIVILVIITTSFCFRPPFVSLVNAHSTCVYTYAHRAKRITAERRKHLAATEAIVDETLEASSTEPEKIERIAFRDILHFPWAIWLVCIICVTYYVAVFPFVSLGLVFFERK